MSGDPSHFVPKVMLVVGARPNFIKAAPILKALRLSGGFSVQLIHTGQHYDTTMNDVFFCELDIAPPDVFLGVGSGTRTEQTAAIMQALEPVVDRDAPDIVVVVGDVTSTLAAALVAAQKQIPVAHVEAGLRSFDRSMPEEINRLLTDQLSDLLFATEEEAVRNLAREGIPEHKVHLVGNVMIDTLRQFVEKAPPPRTILVEGDAVSEFRGCLEQGFALVTLHRPSNVDNLATLRSLLETLSRVADRLPLVFPIHPRTLNAIRKAGFDRFLHDPNILAMSPLPYLSMLGLMREAVVVLTDSGGIQEETTALGIPCLTLRENTERPITVTQGTNRVVGTDSEIILRAVDDVLSNGGQRGRIPPLWDGQAATRIIGHLNVYFNGIDGSPHQQ
jgi:UDP-N-acetylglucosamine 2-epimerase (non-hydrolysing)